MFIGRLRASDLGVGLAAVDLAHDHDGLDVVQQPVQERRRQGGIVVDGRIEFEAPGPDDRLCGVATLTPLDMVTSKLLANSDRWRDDAVLCRDLIDLAMMAPSKKLLQRAMAMTTVSKAALWSRIRALVP